MRWDWKVLKDFKKENEILQKRDAHLAYKYAKRFKSRWPEAEIFIKSNFKTAYFYAKYIVKNRWIEAEDAIKQNAEYAYLYARNVIKGRWIEAEDFIKKEPISYFYAKYLIKNRWPEAEESIKKDPCYAYWYARYIIKKRWVEAEPTIRQDAWSWKSYLKLMCSTCNGEGVIDLGIGGAEEECSTCSGNGLWLLN